MKKSIFSRRVLLSSAFSVVVVGLIAGCSGGGSFNRNDDNDSSATRANVVFSNATGAANTTTIDLQGSRPEVNADTTGVHAGFSEQFDEFHILLLSKAGSISRTLRFEIETNDPANPEEGEVGLVEEGDIGLRYTERSGTVTSWTAISGSITVTDVTSDGYEVSLSNVQFRSTTSQTDVFTLNGTVNLEKSAVTVEPDSTYHSHQDGFIVLADRTKVAAPTHATESKTPKKFKW